MKLKKILISLSILCVSLPTILNNYIISNENKQTLIYNDFQKFITNENMVKIGHKVFNGIKSNINFLDDESKNTVYHNISHLLDNDLSILIYNYQIDNNTLSIILSNRIYSLYHYEFQENNEKNCGSIFSSHFWISIGWELAIGLSWIPVIAFFGISFASDVYNWFTGAGCDFDVVSSWNTFDDLFHKKVVESALQFKMESNCDSNYSW